MYPESDTALRKGVANTSVAAIDETAAVINPTGHGTETMRFKNVDVGDPDAEDLLP